MVSFFGTVTSPSSGDSSPMIMRKRVVLPAPFGPTRPTFSPGFSWKDASTKRICLPYCLLTLANEIMNPQAYNIVHPWIDMMARMSLTDYRTLGRSGLRVSPFVLSAP